MSKSMYSLILTDEVIDRIDRIAKLQGKSRSGLIDQILAQYVSMTTPEQRIKNLYELMLGQMQRFSDEFRFLTDQGDLTAVSALKYKYNPTIRYSVILYREVGQYLGELRATLRTQNAVLLGEYTSFLRLWNKIERGVTDSEVQAQLKGGTYRRLLKKQGGEPEEISKAITDHITTFNDCFKLYLSDGGSEKAVGEITKKYIEYCERGVLL